MHVTLERVEDKALHIKMFWFRPEKPVEYISGQFTQMQLPLDHPDTRGSKHWFTISSSPTEAMIAITTKFAPNHGSTFKHALEKLKPGAKLNLADPMGDFVLPKNKSMPLLFVAGGIGITPYRSIIKWLVDTGERRDIHLVYGVRDKRELAFLDLFKQYDMKFTPIVTEPDSGWKGEKGLLSAKRILELAGEKSNRLIYISGPEPMVEKFVDDLDKLNVPKSRLVTDYFPGYTQV